MSKEPSFEVLKKLVVEYLKELERNPRDLAYIQNLRNQLKALIQ